MSDHLTANIYSLYNFYYYSPRLQDVRNSKHVMFNMISKEIIGNKKNIIYF
jgi:hypothetical protein